MSEPTPEPAPSFPTGPEPPPRPAEAVGEHAKGLGLGDVTGDREVDRKLAAIEMEGEEVALGWKATPHRPLAPEVRFLHISRTIDQLITDRNRSVGIFLFVASLLVGASSALLNAQPATEPILPMRAIRYWCLPVTFGTLGVLGVFISLILIRARIGLIFEVEKMNALLGLPAGRVRRVNPLSIFFLMHLLVVVLGGASAGFAVGMLDAPRDAAGWRPVAEGVAVAVGYVLTFETTYYLTILRTTREAELAKARG